MSRTLADDRIRDARLPYGDFGEVVTFFAAEGGPVRQITVLVSSARRRVEEGPITASQTDELEIRFLKDQSDADYGGLTRPVATSRLADTILRQGDGETERYTFTGEVVRDTAAEWTLRYTRPRPMRTGARPRQG